jgi:hypothetical protein
MKKVILLLLILTLLSPCIHAQGLKLGVGAFGGMNIPVVQDDQKTGSVFGFRAGLRVLPFLIAEPNVTFGKWGSPDEVEGVKWEIDGSKINSYGIDAIIGNVHGIKGFKPYGILGAGIYSIKNDDTGYDESKLGFSGGFGFGIGLSPMLDVDVAGRLVVAAQEEGSKKALFVTAGLNYYFNLGQ